MIRVILIEDDDEIRRSLELILNGSLGFSCIAAFSTAEQTIEGFPVHDIDVALVDIHLPGKSGIELIAYLKPRFPKVQYLVFTVFDDDENIYKALRAGATGYLLKSTPPAKILESIQEIFNGASPMSGTIARRVIASFGNSHSPTNKDWHLLSTREQEILTCLSKGFRYKEIANQLFISQETVRTHIRNIYEKLQVESGIEAISKIFNQH